MPVQPPTLDQLTTIANRLDLRMNEDELAAATELAKPMVAVYGRLDELPDERLPVRYPRSSVGYRPVGDENPCNGWAWRCSIPGAERGPLAGRTVGVKDNICVAGIPMLNGSPVMEGYVPSEDATVVTRLLDAGAHIVGKTAVPGLCVDAGGITGYPEPQPLNPWDERHLPGASSSGSAVVVVTGQADLAVGGDQAGSIRLPASWSGCCGHKPTYGLVPYTGIFPLELTIDHVGPMARTVADCALMLEVMAGADGLDPRQIDVRTQPYAAALDQGAEGLRVGVLREGFGMPHVSEADVDDAVLAAAEVLAQAGASVEDVSVPMHDDSLAVWSAITTEGLVDMGTHGEGLGLNHKGHYSTDLMDFYSRARRARAHDLPKVVKLVLLVGSYVSESTHHHYYAKGQNLGRRLCAAYDEALERVDVLLLPTTPMKALPVPEGRSLAEVVASATGNIHNTAAFDVTGHPALSVPCGVSDGRPVGAMLVGRRFDDATVLRAGHAYEQARGALGHP
jgi:amidase